MPTAWEPPKLHRKALVHGHCHHKSILGFEGEKQLLARLGLDLELPDSGLLRHGRIVRLREAKSTTSRSPAASGCCCRAVRSRAPTALVVADGFSCREQIVQATGRAALHLAEVMRLALREGHSGAANGKRGAG